MKFIVTEDQHSKMYDLSKLKNAIFRFWDKMGGTIKGLNVIFSIPRLIEKHRIEKFEINKWLIEWRGGEKETIGYIKEKLKGSHNVNEFSDFGGYDFNFIFENVSVSNTIEPSLFGVCIVDDLNGSVNLIAADGDHLTLADALNNDDYGWEIKSEVDWGIQEWLTNITDTTGFEILYDLKFKSDE